MAVAIHNFDDLKRYHGRNRRCRECEPLESDQAQRAVAVLSGQQSELVGIADERRKQRRLVRKALRDLALGELALLRARYCEGLTYGQMAKRFGRTPEAVRKVCNRLLRKLRGEFAD